MRTLCAKGADMTLEADKETVRRWITGISVSQWMDR